MKTETGREIVQRKGRLLSAIVGGLVVIATGVQPSVAAPLRADVPGQFQTGQSVAPSDRSVAASVATLVIDGRGNGHGIGLSQYGALGYAIDEGWSADQILNHYYGGTTAGSSDPAGWITVRLTALDEQQTAVVHPLGRATTPSDPQARQWGSIVTRETAPSVYRIWARVDQTCPAATANLDDPLEGWTVVADGVTPRVDIDPAVGSESSTNMDDLLAVCLPEGGARSYRGSITAVNGTVSENRTVNEVPIEQYLRSVVGAEVPASWAAAGGGRGIEALKAQAVAARSYALTQNRYSFALTCDTQACQVYNGAGRRSTLGGSISRAEFPETDQAVAATAGQVRRTGTGTIANTMFSSSSGGWTSPSTSPGFPAVEDLGDDTSSNPHHRWTANVAASLAEQTWPQIGTLDRIVVTRRNGLGEWGGRVLNAVVVGSTGEVAVTGDDLRRALGLKSNWFSIRSLCPAGVAPAGSGPMPTMSALRYSPVNPTRVIDTRLGIGTVKSPVPAGCTLVVTPPGRPAGATAVAVTITTTGTSANGFITSYPCGTRRPNTSSVQMLAGVDVPATTIVPVSAEGALCLFVSSPTEVLVDVLGWWAPTGAELQSAAPRRILDTRSSSRPEAGSVTRVTLPADLGPGATGVSVNLTSTGATTSGYVTVYGCDSPLPDTSVLNIRRSVDVANRAFMPIGPDRSFCLWTSAPTHLIVDIDGWFTATGGTSVDMTEARRAVDTRSDFGIVGRFVAGVARSIDLGEPSKAAIVQITAVDASSAGFITVYPCGPEVPNASVLNTSPLRNVANLVVMPTDAEGRLCIVTSISTDVLIDVLGQAPT